VDDRSVIVESSAAAELPMPEASAGAVPGANRSGPGGTTSGSGTASGPGGDGSQPAPGSNTGSGTPAQPALPLELRTLTLGASGSGAFGLVRSTPPGLDCSAPPCSAAFPVGTAVTLQAWTGRSSGAGFAGWSGACSGLDLCTLTLTDDVTLDARYEPANRVFVTSLGQSGALGGLAGADALCSDLARQGGIQGSVRAWLSTSSVSAIDRLLGSRGWVRTDGRAVLDTLQDIPFGVFSHPIRTDELGRDVGSTRRVFTGTGPDGRAQGNETCDDWTTNAITLGSAGSPNGVSASFTQAGSYLCSEPLGLYCFEVGKSVRVTPAPFPGRLAFVALLALDGGLAGADAQCQAQAAALERLGTFRAVLASEGASAASRFDLSGAPWVTMDGVPITDTAAELFESPRWNTAPGQNVMRRWTATTMIAGGSSLLEPGTSADTCANWTSSSAELTLLQGFSQASDPFGFFYGDGALATCALPTFAVLCLQE
jgi:hypothetical protein